MALVAREGGERKREERKERERKSFNTWLTALSKSGEKTLAFQKSPDIFVTTSLLSSCIFFYCSP